MTSRIHNITIDADDPARVAGFWAAALGYVADVDDPTVEVSEALVVDPSGRHPGLLFQRVPEPKLVKNRIHLDVQAGVGGREATVEELLAIGATLLDDHRKADGTGWAVLADPEGNEFCVERSAAERRATDGTGGDEGVRPGWRQMDFGRTDGERAMLENLLEWYRAGVLAKVEGLDDAQARRRHVGSPTTIAGLVNHLALVEDNWFTDSFDGQLQPPAWEALDFDADPDAEFTEAQRVPFDELVARYRAACERSRAVASKVSLDTEAARFDPARGPFTLRWVLMHMLEETARHLGHLDILRELTDGRTGG